MKTAEEALGQPFYPHECGGMIECVTKQEALKTMIEFAKMHVEQIRELIQAKYYAGETGYIRAEEWKDILNDIK